LYQLTVLIKTAERNGQDMYQIWEISADRDFVGKPEGKEPLQRPKRADGRIILGWVSKNRM
jgi:hypothetical protein